MPHARRIYVSRVLVRCNRVPFDMMRLDHCVPNDAADAHKLARMHEGEHLSEEDALVTFVRYSSSADGPSPRWAIAGCHVINWERVVE